MHTWVYYLNATSPEVFMLYRVKEDLRDPERLHRLDPQVYNRTKGWIPDEALIGEMNRTGFLSQQDVISEDRALDLIASLRTGTKTNRAPTTAATPAPAAPKIKNPLEGVTLETIVTKLVENYGWERLGDKIRIKCFIENPSLKSSLTFLRKTPWARTKVEQLYIWREKTGWDPRDNDK